MDINELKNERKVLQAQFKKAEKQYKKQLNEINVDLAKADFKEQHGCLPRKGLKLYTSHQRHPRIAPNQSDKWVVTIDRINYNGDLWIKDPRSQNGVRFAPRLEIKYMERA